jgi:hypothetical protein
VFEIYEQDLSESDLPVPQVHVPNWFFQWQGPVSVLFLSGLGYAFSELQERGLWKDNETALPWVVVLLIMAWAAIVLAHTGPSIKRQFLKRDRVGRRVVGGLCFAAAAVFVVLLFVVFDAVRNLRIEQKAEVRAADTPTPPPPAPGAPGGTSAPAGDSKTGERLDVNLGDPYVQQRRAEQAEKEARDARDRNRDLEFALLRRQVADLQAAARRPANGAANTGTAAAGPAPTSPAASGVPSPPPAVQTGLVRPTLPPAATNPCLAERKTVNIDPIQQALDEGFRLRQDYVTNRGDAPSERAMATHASGALKTSLQSFVGAACLAPYERIAPLTGRPDQVPADFPPDKEGPLRLFDAQLAHVQEIIRVLRERLPAK